LHPGKDRTGFLVPCLITSLSYSIKYNKFIIFNCPF
jgi:hypothetical protein